MLVNATQVATRGERRRIVAQALPLLVLLLLGPRSRPLLSRLLPRPPSLGRQLLPLLQALPKADVRDDVFVRQLLPRDGARGVVRQPSLDRLALVPRRRAARRPTTAR